MFSCCGVFVDQADEDGTVVDLTNDSGVEDELVDLTSPVSCVEASGCLQMLVHDAGYRHVSSMYMYSGVEDELVDLTSPVSCVEASGCLQMLVHDAGYRHVSSMYMYSGVEDELVDLTSPVSCVHTCSCRS
jgi:hypothetical protein